MASVSGQQGMLTLPRHLIPPLVHVYPGVRVCHSLMFVFLFFVWITRLILKFRHHCLSMQSMNIHVHNEEDIM